jgi:integrase
MVGKAVQLASVIRAPGRYLPRHAPTNSPPQDAKRERLDAQACGRRYPRHDLPSYSAPLLLTGLRRTEAARASWSEIEYLRRDDHQGYVLTIPAARMKGKLDHAVPLAPRALALLGQRPKTADARAYPFVFSNGGGERAFRGYGSIGSTIQRRPQTPPLVGGSRGGASVHSSR